MEKALKTITEMLYDRSLFDSYYKDIHTASLTLIVNDDNKHIVLPCSNICIVFDLKKTISKLDDIADAYKHIILVTNVDVKLDYPGVRIESFLLKELLFNISTHSLVPKHVIVKKESVQELLRDYNIKSPLLLPHILENDPMARYIGAIKGDVVKVLRNSITCGEHVMYRCCV